MAGASVPAISFASGSFPGGSMYNFAMTRNLGLFATLAFAGLLACSTLAQAPAKSSPPAASQAQSLSAAQHAVALAESGKCSEALPLLKKAVHQATDREAKKRLGLLGLNCAMTHGAPYDSLDFLAILHRDFPNDPDVLYAATHAYSDLSVRTSQELVREAPFSYQVHMLNAEALETQGKWQEAAAEYQKIIDINPMLPGIHARIGRALLASPQPAQEAVAQARKDFEEELVIDPNNATAEFVLGELSKDDDFGAAIRHYTRATKIDASFAEAYLSLGTVLVFHQQFAEAVPPLETYEKLAPDSPTGHFQLAMAYNGVGRKDDANREAALQRETAKNLEQLKRRVAEGLEHQKPPQ